MPSDHRTAQRGRRGRVVPGVHCPLCGGQVEYNGNYFCERLERPYKEPEACSWALSSNDRGEPIGMADRVVWAKIKKEWGLGDA